jgi:hypothetical protein
MSKKSVPVYIYGKPSKQKVKKVENVDFDESESEEVVEQVSVPLVLDL